MRKYQVSSKIDVKSISLIKEDPIPKLVYSRLQPYTFRVNVTDTVSVNDLQMIKLILDPDGENIKILWDRESGNFSELLDPHDYININNTSKARNNLYYWDIDFNITFNWTYPDEDLHKVQAYAYSEILPPVYFNVTNLYKVENDIEFTGSLLVKGEDDQIITENDVVHGGENLNWTGLIPVYQGNTDLFPPAEEFDITIWDEDGYHWSDSPNWGETFHIETLSPIITKVNGYNFTINITGIPPGADATNINFTIKFDADNVMFTNHTPNNTIWQTVSNVPTGITIKDIGGALVDGSSIMRRISTNEGVTWSDWEEISDLSDNQSIIVQDLITIEDGTDNLIKWQAVDTLGNGPVESDAYKILVDTENIEFSNAWPTINEVSSSKKVDFGITISDSTSGVNISSIQYTVSEDLGQTWSVWKSVEGYENGSEIVIQINDIFPNGTENQVKWRASDTAGNGPAESQPITINVNVWTNPIRPKVNLLSPPNELIINKTYIELTWLLEEFIDGVTYDLYFDDESPPELYQSNIENTSFYKDGLLDGQTYYWNVIPRLDELKGSSNADPWWWFKVKLGGGGITNEVYGIDIQGKESITVKQGENRTIVMTIKNLGSAEDEIRLELDAGKLTEYISIGDPSNLKLESNIMGIRNLKISPSKTVPPGSYNIIVTAISLESDEKEKDSLSIDIEIIKFDDNIVKPNGDGNKTSLISDNIILFSIITIIIIIFVLITALFFISKRKKAREEKLAASVTIKPMVSPASVLGQEPPPAVQAQVSTINYQLPVAGTTASTTPQPQVLAIPQQATAGPATTFTQPVESPQMPQIAQAPLLPPAQITTSEQEAKESMLPENIVPQELQPAQVQSVQGGQTVSQTQDQSSK